jgi:hypothetical protein
MKTSARDLFKKKSGAFFPSRRRRRRRRGTRSPSAAGVNRTW